MLEEELESGIFTRSSSVSIDEWGCLRALDQICLVFGHVDDAWPLLGCVISASGGTCRWHTLDRSHDLADLAHLISLEWQRFLAVQLRFIALEDRSQRQQLGVDTAYSPHI